ncbi:hypothetical protein LCGC14_0980580, partial [marine sediment metagenome]
ALTGEFGSVIDAASNLVGAERGKTSRAAMARAIADENYAAAYKLTANNVEESLTGEVKSRFASSRNDFEVMVGMRNAIQEYVDAGGDIGFLKGKADTLAKNFGQIATDPEFAALGAQLTREFQTYRNIMTGAAFTPKESREYALVNPRADASLDLNLATIDGALAQLENRITGTVNARIPDAQGLFDRAFGEPETIDPALEPIGTIVNIGGVLYRKTGEDTYEDNF